MKNVELLSPAGDFECLKAAIQNGANAVYLGATSFSARSSASNFNDNELEQAIDYAHIRNVKVYLALNTLIKNSEINEAIKICEYAYKFGIDAIIVQDLGIASILMKYFPDLPIHASTQMTINNLNGVIEAKKLGFKRVILSREVSLSEIKNICQNSNLEIEVFVHGALCISYSGQCLFSSLVGGRSANRGNCAQACRLPYQLLENDKIIDKNYLISPKDLCTLDLLPSLIDSGITSFKIEGRLKSPEYVAIVTSIYRKYIDKYLNNEPYIIENEDRKILMLAFNRGNFSTGHLKEENNNLIFKDRPNNIGVLIGTVQSYNSKKGYVTLVLKDNIEIGDKIILENEDNKYTISEIMDNKYNNIKNVKPNMCVTIGRMKGNIKSNDKVYKISSKTLYTQIKESYTKCENIKIPLKCYIHIKRNEPITVDIVSCNSSNNYKDLNINIISDIIPENAINNPITKDKIISQFSKTNNTPYHFTNIEIELDDNIYINSIGSINSLRRDCINYVEKYITKKYKRNFKDNILLNSNEYINKNIIPKIALLLNNIEDNYDYSKIKKVDKIYIPLKYFFKNKYNSIINILSENNKIYIYMPSIIRDSFVNIFLENINKTLKTFKISGFVLSNISQIDMLKEYKENYEFIANYSLNIFNNHSSLLLEKQGVNTITISPELSNDDIININSNITKEFIVYGRLVLMSMQYCLLGNTNKCYDKCKMRCKDKNKYYLKDRLGFKFRIIPDNIQTITSIYNAKINSIDYTNLNLDCIRIDILDENIDEINKIIDITRSGKRIEGSNYTNGNLYRNI